MFDVGNPVNTGCYREIIAPGTGVRFEFFHAALKLVVGLIVLFNET